MRLSGLARWEQIRAGWVAPSSSSPARRSQGSVVAKKVNVEDVIERVFSGKAGGNLEQPVPLGQMIDMLVDIWESEGLFD